MSGCSIIPINKISHHKTEPVFGAVIFTDLKASSKLWSADVSKNWQEYIFDIVELHFEIIFNIVKNFNKKNRKKAKVIKTIGDALMIFCPWSFKEVLNISLCIQNNMANFNNIIIEDITKRYSKKRVLDIFKSIPEPRGLTINGGPVIFGIRLGFCYGRFNKIKTILQNNKFDDVFGIVVNLASRMESKIGSVSGCISFTYYFEKDQSNFDKEIKRVLIKRDNSLLNNYTGLQIKTTDKLDKDILELLHGALPPSKNLIIYTLVPKTYKFKEFFLDKSDILKGLENFRKIY